MRGALYFPDLEIRDPGFLFESLLYWDELACITPPDFDCDWFKRGYRDLPDSDPELARAAYQLVDRYVHPYTPSEAEIEAAHRRVVELFADRSAPEKYRPKNLAPEETTVLFVKKVGPDTTAVLRASGWFEKYGTDSDIVVRAAANLILSTLAEEIAGVSIPLVTNQETSFRSACDALLLDLSAADGEVGVARDPASATLEDEGRDLSLEVVQVPRLVGHKTKVRAKDLRKLWAMRSDSSLTEQRQAFRARVDTYLAQLRGTQGLERQMLQADWLRELNDDLDSFRKELAKGRLRAGIALKAAAAFTDRVAAGAGASAVLGPHAVPIGAAGGVVLGVVQAGSVYRRERENGGRKRVVTSHWSAWLEPFAGGVVDT